jgi:uncharacterized protein YjbI with pentapeptide repeats
LSNELADEHAQISAEAPVLKWGDPISTERQVELQEYLDRWQAETDHGEREGPFHGVGMRLTGADVSWLAEQSGRNENRYASNLGLQRADLRKAHLEGADLSWANLEYVDFREAQLQGADLSRTQLQGANLFQAQLEHANLTAAQLEGAILTVAQLRSADLIGAQLEGAALSEAHLESADLTGAQLKDADLRGARLEGADLTGVQLEGADLRGVQLEGADLTAVRFDKASRLNDVVLTRASFDQVSFDNTNLTVVDWSLVTTLGDEDTAWAHKGVDDKPKTRETRLDEFKAAVRANRVLSVNLQAQGLAEDGDRFAYRAQVLQRQVLRLQRKYGAYLFSWLLAGLAGYGYRLRRIFVVYGVAVLLFAIGYFLAGGVTLQAHLSLHQQALDALQVSLNAIHGRVFFTQLGLDTLQSWLATLESIVGIVIEGVFVAMLIQRFFAR